MTPSDIYQMKAEELLDINHFLSEDDLFDDEVAIKGFYVF